MSVSLPTWSCVTRELGCSRPEGSDSPLHASACANSGPARELCSGTCQSFLIRADFYARESWRSIHSCACFHSDLYTDNRTIPNSCSNVEALRHCYWAVSLCWILSRSGSWWRSDPFAFQSIIIIIGPSRHLPRSAFPLFYICAATYIYATSDVCSAL
jgi:hypothetical protein